MLGNVSLESSQVAGHVHHAHCPAGTAQYQVAVQGHGLFLSAESESKHNLSETARQAGAKVTGAQIELL